MRSRLLAGATTVVLAAAGLMVSAGPASADCSHPTHPDEYNGGGIYWQNGGTPIRSGPHRSCDRRGTGNPGEGIDVHCAVLSDHTNWEVWVFVRNGADGTSGWAHEDNLRIPGGWKSVGDCWGSGDIAVGV